MTLIWNLFEYRPHCREGEGEGEGRGPVYRDTRDQKRGSITAHPLWKQNRVVDITASSVVTKQRVKWKSAGDAR